MNDIEKALKEDSRDKAITARSSHNTRTHNGKSGSIRFPSDNLTPGQIKKMSSEVTKYDLNLPMPWVCFRAMPLDLQREYYKKVRETFHAGFDDLGRLFSWSGTMVRRYITDMGLKDGHRWKPDEEHKKLFERFLNGESIKAITAEPAPTPSDSEDFSTCYEKVLSEAQEAPTIEELPKAINLPDVCKIRSLTIQLKAAENNIDLKDRQIEAQEHELEILRAQMQVVWGFLGRDSDE